MNLQASRLPAKLELCVPLGIYNVRHRSGNYLISHLTFHKEYGRSQHVHNTHSVAGNYMHRQVNSECCRIHTSVSVALREKVDPQ